jgi:hypothetical protein
VRWGPAVRFGDAKSPPLALGEARLVSPGYRRSQGVLFAVAGDDKGKPSIQLATIGMAAGGDGPGGPSFDKDIKLTPAFAFARTLPQQLLPILDDAAAALHLIWSEHDGKKWSVRHNLIQLAGKAGTDLLVLEREEPLLAMAAPIVTKGSPSVTALFGKEGGPLLHIRARIDGKGTPAVSEIPQPGDKVTAWAVSDDSPHVLALEGRRLLVHGPGYKEWTRIAEVAASSSHLRVFTAQPGESWAEWFDPKAGLRHERLILH